MFDLIVVGAGSAGAVIAARASESGKQRVLLIEAGPDYADDELPRDLVDGRHNSMRDHDWGFRMRANSRMRPSFDYPRGKVVGGSSAVNTCIALRSKPSDYDAWGFPDWRFDALLPYFKKLERDLDFGEQPWHGAGGPIPIRRFKPSELVPWQAAFVEAGIKEGLPYAEDANDPAKTFAIGPHAMNVIGGVRQSVAKCYLTREVRTRDNFELLANTHVRRVLTKPLAIELDSNERIQAKRIVLCAGAVMTPWIMLRSGLGPRASVERLGVELVREVPGVAEQMWEHPGSAVFFKPKRGVMTFGDPLVQTVLRMDDMYVQPGSRVVFPRFQVPLVTVAGHVGRPRIPGRIVFDKGGPRIFAHALEDAEDRRDMREALLVAIRLALSTKLATPFFPRHYDDLDEYMRKWSGTGYHPCGTVPMGVSTDARGAVRDVPGLFVADASLMPQIPMANTNLTTIAIGERIGEWLSV